MPKKVLLALALVLSFVAAGGALAWRAVASAREGEVLVLADRALAGPIRVFVSPLAARRAVPARSTQAVEVPFALGQGASWPLAVQVETVLDPAALDARGRQVLLDGSAPRLVADAARQAAEAALQATPGDRVIGRPAALADPIRRQLAAALPPGLAPGEVSVRVDVPPEQARAAALAAVRRAAVPPLARVLYLGLDGMDWEILGPLIARGEAPNLGRLAREGVRAELLAYEPIVSPLLWTTAVTGRTPDEHGVADFVVTSAEGKVIPIPSGFRTAPALWEILGAADQSSGFANFWATQPAEEVQGVLVSDVADRVLGDHDRKPGLPPGTASPRSFLEERIERFYTTDTIPAERVRAWAPSLDDAEIEDARRYWRDPARRNAWAAAHPDDDDRKTPIPAFLLKNATHVANIERIGLALLEDPALGVVGLYFRDPDDTGHSFQHLAPPPHPLAPPEERARYADTVENSYRAIDAVVGRLVTAAGPGTAVIVHSDHGFRWGARRPVEVMPFAKGQPVEWHRLQGVFLAGGGPFRRGADAAPVTLFDIAPTILALRGVPADESMPGQVRTDLLEPSAAGRLPRQRIPTWAALVAPRRYENASGEELEAAQQQMVEALKGLGYVDDRAGRSAASGGEGAEPSGADRPNVMYHRNLATFLMNQDRFADAERELLRANEVELQPKTFWLLSEARAARGDVRGARQALEQGLAALPDKTEPSTVLWLVELALREGDPAGAEAVLARQSALLAREPAVRATAEGRIAEAKGDAAGARARYLEALRIDPRQSRAAERVAALSTTPAERAALVPFLEQALARDQHIEIYWKMLGLIRLEAGDASGAAAALARAAELEPGDEELAMTLATALARAGRPADARVVYERLAAAGTQRAPAWVNLGSLRAQAGDWRGARAAWERALELGADSPQLRAGLAEARRRTGG
ncbi:MAG: alkaline phosphatase family protein [Acidobacteria bacterium]|nr:alkaline phosphatase family protein [Acidobacteriota bacterium]